MFDSEIKELSWMFELNGDDISDCKRYGWYWYDQTQYVISSLQIAKPEDNNTNTHHPTPTSIYRNLYCFTVVGNKIRYVIYTCKRVSYIMYKN